LLNKISVDLVGCVRDRDRFDLVAKLLDERSLVLGVEPVMQIHLALEALHHHGLARRNQQYLRLFASHFEFSLPKPAP